MKNPLADDEAAGFPPATVAAPRRCDAITLEPRSADREPRSELRRHFTDERIAESCLDVARWSERKQLVALRLEEPSVSAPVVFSWDASGSDQHRGFLQAVGPRA